MSNVLKLSFIDKKVKTKRIKTEKKITKENIIKILPCIQNKNIDSLIENIKIPFEINKNIIDLFYIEKKDNFVIETMYS